MNMISKYLKALCHDVRTIFNKISITRDLTAPMSTRLKSHTKNGRLVGVVTSCVTQFTKNNPYIMTQCL